MLPLLAMLAAAAAPAPPARIDEAGVITVTASRIEELADAAAECARRRCSVRQDVAVSVAYGSTLFDAGRYVAAKSVLRDAIARVKRSARAEPVAVSTLWNALANLEMHEGDQAIVKAATWGSFLTLRDGLAPDALPTLTAEFRLAEWQQRTGDRAGARTRHADIARRAAAAGHRQLADASLLRLAQLLDAGGDHAGAIAALNALAARRDDETPDAADVRRAALATMARMADSRGDRDTAAATFARLLREPPGPEPQLISLKPLPQPGREEVDELLNPDAVVLDRGSRGGDLVGLRWIDIGFWIRPDGSVAGVERLRGSERSGWAAPLLAAVAARRYSPFAAPAGSGGRYRTERFTLTADYATPMGSLVRRRLVNPRFENSVMSDGAPATAGS